MTEELKELMDFGAHMAKHLASRGDCTYAAAIRDMVRELSAQESIIDKQKAENDLLRKQLSFLRSAATEQARIIKDYRRGNG